MGGLNPAISDSEKGRVTRDVSREEVAGHWVGLAFCARQEVPNVAIDLVLVAHHRPDRILEGRESFWYTLLQ